MRAKKRKPTESTTTTTIQGEEGTIKTQHRACLQQQRRVSTIQQTTVIYISIFTFPFFVCSGRGGWKARAGSGARKGWHCWRYGAVIQCQKICTSDMENDCEFECDLYESMCTDGINRAARHTRVIRITVCAVCGAVAYMAIHRISEHNYHLCCRI